MLSRGRLFRMMDVTLSPVNTVPLLLLIAQSESWNICYCGAVIGPDGKPHTRYTHTDAQHQLFNHGGFDFAEHSSLCMQC